MARPNNRTSVMRISAAMLTGAVLAATLIAQARSDGPTGVGPYRVYMPGIAVDSGPPKETCAEADTFTFTEALSAPVQSLNFSVERANALTGEVVVNGGDTRQPGVPFTFDWGDGTTSDAFFPATHTYLATSRNYIIRVTGHYPGNLTGEAEAHLWFRDPQIRPVGLDASLAVGIPETVPSLGTRLYPVPTGLIALPASAFGGISRNSAAYLLSVAAQIQHNYANHDVETVGSGFQQVVLGDPSFPQGKYSIWFSTPVALAVGQSQAPFESHLSSIFHEMGHNVTLNSPAGFRFGGRIDGNANAIFSETMAQIFQHATVYDLVRRGEAYGLGCEVRSAIRTSGLLSFASLRMSYQDYVASGSPFASWNNPATPRDETFGTFMTLGYKFFEHAEGLGGGVEMPLKRMTALLGTFDPELMAAYDPGHDTPEADAFRATLMVAALSAAFEGDLREEFRALGFPVDDPIFEMLLAR